MIRRLASFGADLAATVVRVFCVFAALTLVFDAGQRLALQFAPPSFWFSLDRVEVLPTGQYAIAYRHSRFGDLPISTITELIGPGHLQPCASSGRRVIEAGTAFAIIPLSRALPDCKWGMLPDGDYYLSVTAAYPAGGTIDKAVTVRSKNALVVRRGAIVGATLLAPE